MNSLPPQIVAAIMALIGAVLGYIYREYRNKVQPFFQITKIDGAVNRRSDLVAIEKSVADRLLGSQILLKISTIREKAFLGEIFDVWDRADDLQRHWPTVDEAIEEVLQASGDDKFIGALGNLVMSPYFDYWIINGLAIDKIPRPSVTTSRPAKIPIVDSKHDPNKVWICIPGKNFLFGRQLSEPAVRGKVTPLLDAISRVDKEPIRETLTAFRELLAPEFGRAEAVAPKLKEVIDHSSLWMFYIFLANVSNYPIVIETTGRLLVRDGDIKFKEETYMAINQSDGTAVVSWADANTPLVVRPGSDVSFAMITKNRQQDMRRGGAFREAFDKGKASMKIRLRIQRVGLVKRQWFSSQWIPFSKQQEQQLEGLESKD